MKFSKKIGLSFLLLTSITVLTGCIGLLFVYRVLNAFGAVTTGEEPLVRDLEDLNRYMQKAVDISQEISHEKEIEDILQIRKEYSQFVHEFDRSFSRIRKGLEDEMTLGTLERFKVEQNELRAQTHELIEAIIEELKAENAYRESLIASDKQWQKLVDGLRQAAQSLAATEDGLRISGEPVGTEPPAARGTVGKDLLFKLRFLTLAQQLFLEMRFKLKEYLSVEEPTRLAAAAGQLEDLHASASLLFKQFEAPNRGEQTTDQLTAVAQAFNDWAQGLLREHGLLELYREALILKIHTDTITGRMESEAGDALRMLDSVVALGSRLSVQSSDRGFVTAAPTLLVLAVALATFLSILFAVVLTHTITRPVATLIEITEAVGRGDYSRRLKLISGDEFANLGEAFNRMVEEVNRSQKEIQTLNVGLEQRVRERTAELEEEITERRKAEDSLRESEDRYRTLITNFPNGIIALIDRERRFIAVGGRGISRVNAQAEDLAGKKLEEVFPKEILGHLTPKLAATFAGERQAFEYHIADLDWQVYMVPNPPTGKGGVETITVLSLDVTEAKRVEQEMKQKQEQLVQADKLASLGVLVAGVAHEINNPNQAIMMGGQLLRKAWPDIQTVLNEYHEQKGDFLIGGISYAELRKNLDEHFSGIIKSAKRIDTIVQGLKDFARQDHEEMTQIVNLNMVVKSALILLSNVLKKATDRLTVDLSPKIPTLRGNTQRIEQVVINLLQNACQALPNRKKGITVCTSTGDGGECVILEVHDEGVGIPPENLTRVQDPFFTTKRETRGTGLGLSVSSTIVKEHGGELQFSSEPGRGTMVRVLFPVHPLKRGQ